MSAECRPNRAEDDAPAGDVDVVAVLERWQHFGGTWRVLSRTAGRAVISLRRCDGGEELRRITSADPSVLAWLDSRLAGSP
jgi:hypothetical protein